MKKGPAEAAELCSPRYVPFFYSGTEKTLPQSPVSAGNTFPIPENLCDCIFKFVCIIHNNFRNVKVGSALQFDG